MSEPCKRLHDAYLALRKDLVPEKFQAFMAAFEADLRDDAYGFEPITEVKDGKPTEAALSKWNTMTTPKGTMLTLFTSLEEVRRHTAPGSAGISLSDFLAMALSGKGITGILVNPLDGEHGIPVERPNLEILARRVGLGGGRLPPLNPEIAQRAMFALFDIAVGVPTPVYDIKADLEKLGGAPALLKPVVEAWMNAMKTGAFKPSGPDEYVTKVLREVTAKAFVAGAFVRKDLELAKAAKPEECLPKTPGIEGDIVQNVDEYLVILFGAIRQMMPQVTTEQLWAIAAENVATLGFGMMCFGLGWGIAKYVEGLPAYEMAGLKRHEEEFLKKMKEGGDEVESK